MQMDSPLVQVLKGELCNYLIALTKGIKICNSSLELALYVARKDSW